MNSVSVDVQEATTKDLSALVALAMEVQQLHADGRPDIFREPDQRELTDFMNARLEDHLVLVARTDGTVVGYLLAENVTREANAFRHAHSTWHVHHVVVDTDNRRTGAGRALMQALADCARTDGTSTVQLSSWAFNTQAHEFFSAQGFAPMSITFEQRLG